MLVLNKKKPCDGLRWFKFKNSPVMGQGDLSLKKSQNVKKMSNVKKSNTHTMEVHKKKKIHIMRFTHIDINFDIKYEGHKNCSKTLSMYILRAFGP